MKNAPKRQRRQCSNPEHPAIRKNNLNKTKYNGLLCEFGSFSQLTQNCLSNIA